MCRDSGQFGLPIIGSKLRIQIIYSIVSASSSRSVAYKPVFLVGGRALSGVQRLWHFGPGCSETRAMCEWSAAPTVLPGRSCMRRPTLIRRNRSSSEGTASAGSRRERRMEPTTILNRVCRLSGFVCGRIRLVRAEAEERDCSEVGVHSLAQRYERLQPRRCQACLPSSRTPCGT